MAIMPGGGKCYEKTKAEVSGMKSDFFKYMEGGGS